MDERLRSHYESLSRVIGFTASADHKAAPVLALQVALVGTLAARFDKLTLILSRQSTDAEALVLLVLLALYGVFLVVSIVVAASVYIPRNTRTGNRSLIYFEDIGAMSCEDFVERAGQMETDVIEGQLLEQVHIVSRIASAKMHRVRWAYYLSGPSVALWVVLLAWGAV